MWRRGIRLAILVHFAWSCITQVGTPGLDCFALMPRAPGGVAVAE